MADATLTLMAGLDATLTLMAGLDATLTLMAGLDALRIERGVSLWELVWG